MYFFFFVITYNHLEQGNEEQFNNINIQYIKLYFNLFTYKCIIIPNIMIFNQLFYDRTVQIKFTWGQIFYNRITHVNLNSKLKQ